MNPKYLYEASFTCLDIIALKQQLSGRCQFVKGADVNDPEGPEKYKNTEVKYGATFYSCNTTLDTLKSF
jgi:hypothetical protein